MPPGEKAIGVAKKANSLASLLPVDGRHVAVVCAWAAVATTTVAASATSGSIDCSECWEARARMISWASEVELR